VGSIYGLYDTEGNLRYIGKANNPVKRLDGHMREAKRRDYPVYRWINKHGRPELRILSENCADWRIEERRLIAEARARGEKLLNVADGGDEPFCSPEVRVSNAKKMAAHPNTQKQRRINGKKTFGRLRQGLKGDGSQYTHEEVVIYAYESVLKMSLKRKAVKSAHMIARKMSEQYNENPIAYARWADFKDVSWLDQA